MYTQLASSRNPNTSLTDGRRYMLVVLVLSLLQIVFIFVLVLLIPLLELRQLLVVVFRKTKGSYKTAKE